MGRNERASFQVWSAEHGYPGDGLYREFHKKDVNSGMHYWRVTSKEADFGEKMLYDPVSAFAQTEAQANHYVGLVRDLLKANYDKTGEPGLLMVSFDTELYGHWWFEGVTWLKHVLRGLATDASEVTVETASQYLEKHPPNASIRLPESTWGAGGHFWVWDNENTNWMWPIIHQAEARMKALQQGKAHFYEEGLESLIHGNLQEKRLAFTTDMRLQWSSRKSGGDYKASFYKPQPPDGFVALMMMAHRVNHFLGHRR